MSTADAPDRVEGVALVAWGEGNFSVEPVTVPGPGRDNIVVDISYSGVSIGTEFGVLKGKIDWGDFPMVTGYMATGTVEMVGSVVEGFSPGDRVYLRHAEGLALVESGETLNCRDGLHCSVASLDPTGNHGAALLPPGVPEDVGSLFTVLTVGLYGVDMAGVGATSTVVVIGLGAIGLGVVAAAAARGARVIGVDLREQCRQLALSFGASDAITPVDNGTEELVRRAIHLGAEGAEGADFVFEATGLPALVDLGIALARPYGSFVWQGHYGEGKVPFEFVSAHHKRLKMYFPCDDGFAAYRASLMRAIASGRLDAGGLITDRLSAADAAAFYESVAEHGSGGSISPVIRWSPP